MLWIIEIRILELPKWPLSKARCHSADDVGHCCPLAFYAAARCGHKGSLDDVVGGSGGEGREEGRQDAIALLRQGDVLFPDRDGATTVLRGIQTV